MLKSYALFVSSLYFLISLVACSSMEVADFRAHITLPASEDGYGISVISKKEIRIPKAEWEKKKKRGIILLSEDYRLLRETIQRNCQEFECEQIIGAFDGLFISIDKALQQIPLD